MRNQTTVASETAAGQPATDPLAACPHAGGQPRFAPPPAPREPRAWRPWLALVVVVLVLAVAWIGVGHWRGSVQVRALARAAAALRAEFEALPSERPVLWGEARDGPAWPHYERAIAAAGGLDSPALARLCRSEGARLRDAAGADAPSALDPARVLAERTGVLDALREGAHCRVGRRPVQWELGFDHSVLDLRVVRNVANLAVLQALAAVHRGSPVEAVHALLDAAQLGRDLAMSAILIEQAIGCAVLGIAGKEAVAMADLLQHLDVDSLRTFGAGLERLDASLAVDGRAIETEAVLFAEHLQAMGSALFDDVRMPVWGFWRYGFSGRLAAADHGFAQLALGARVRALCEGPGALDRAALANLFDEVARSPNPVTRIAAPNRMSLLDNRVQCLVQIRQLRMDVQRALGEPVTPLQDPWGGTSR